MLPYRVHCYMLQVEGLIEANRLNGKDVLDRMDDLLNHAGVPEHMHDEVQEELEFAAVTGWYDKTFLKG